MGIARLTGLRTTPRRGRRGRRRGPSGRRRPQLRAVILALFAAALGAAGSTVALASSSKKPSGHWHGRTRANSRNAFSGLTRSIDRAAGGGSGNIPAGAELAASSDGHSVYVWEAQAATPTTPTGEREVSELDICDAIQSPSGSGGGGCAPAAEVDTRGSVGFTRNVEPTTGQLSPWTVTALVPDGVTSITLIDSDGSTHSVAVTDNVAVAEDASLAEQPAAAVSYELSGGTTESIPLPASAAGD